MPSTRFDIVAQPDPQLLVRVLNYFAQIGLLPSRVSSARVGDLLQLRVDQPGLEVQQSRIIAEKMRSSVLVASVNVRHGRRVRSSINE